MKSARSYILRIIVSLALILVWDVAGNAMKLESSPRDRDIYVDGMQFDWENALVNIPDDEVNIGIMNDNDYLYICLVPLDMQIIRQAMGAGFTTWIESRGKIKNRIGIRFPIGMQNDSTNFAGFDRTEGRPDPEKFLKTAEGSLEEFEIISPDEKDTTTMPVINPSGIEVRIGTRNERMVYELKIPLVKTDEHPYAIGALPGEKIKVKFEAAEFKRPERNRHEHRGGMMRPGEGIGEPGGFGGVPRGGGRGGFPGGRGQWDRPKRFKLELDIKLAKTGSDAD